MTPTTTITAEAREAIIADQVAHFDTTLGVYPQYRGHWATGDDVVILSVKRDVRTKGGPAFVKGQLVIAHAHAVEGIAGFTAYSPVRGGMVFLSAARVEVRA